MQSIGRASHMKERAQADIGVRQARPDDAQAAAAVLCASIAGLCVADHGDDPKVIARWLANKTPRDVHRWIEAPGRVFVAEEYGRIVGVGAVATCGQVALNYVLPDARFRGVSKILLSALEAYLRSEGHARSTLSSTRTAYRFYLAAGYVDAGKPESWHGLTAFPMAKDL